MLRRRTHNTSLGQGDGWSAGRVRDHFVLDYANGLGASWDGETLTLNILDPVDDEPLAQVRYTEAEIAELVTTGGVSVLVDIDSPVPVWQAVRDHTNLGAKDRSSKYYHRGQDIHGWSTGAGFDLYYSDVAVAFTVRTGDQVHILELPLPKLFGFVQNEWSAS